MQHHNGHDFCLWCSGKGARQVIYAFATKQATKDQAIAGCFNYTRMMCPLGIVEPSRKSPSFERADNAGCSHALHADSLTLENPTEIFSHMQAMDISNLSTMRIDAKVIPFRRFCKKLIAPSIMRNWCSFESVFPGEKKIVPIPTTIQHFSVIRDH